MCQLSVRSQVFLREVSGNSQAALRLALYVHLSGSLTVVVEAYSGVVKHPPSSSLLGLHLLLLGFFPL